MKKIILILSVLTFIGFVFSPVIISGNSENTCIYSDTTKTVKKTKTKTKTKSGCQKHCCSASCPKTDKKTKSNSDDKK
jgi:hypothetical protein